MLVFGAINTDFVTYVDTLPAPGETVSGGTFASYPGGKGANQAVAAARTGASVDFFGCVGDDALGQERLRSLEEAGVSARHVTVKPGVHSGIALIMVDRAGENLIAVAPGANALLGPADIVFPESVNGRRVVALLQNEIAPASAEAMLRKCHQEGMVVVWNTAPAPRGAPSPETLRAVDYLICNQHELRTMAGDGPTEALAHQVRDRGPANVIVTLGSDGSLLASAEGTYRQEAFPVEAADTVGTGDCFCGVFAGSLANGLGVRDALRTASAAAALSATMMGAQTSMPTAGEVRSFLARHGQIDEGG
jgi:ribokinase